MSILPQDILKSHIAGLTHTPGIYRFYDKNRELLYIGKAKNLKKRLSSYLRHQQSIRISSLINQINSIEVTVTHTETDALLLESNTIKTLKPRYNILLRDDKSYPYLTLSAHTLYPRLNFYRGKPKGNTEYFGPYPSVLAVKETLNLLQKLFQLRSCNDTFFKNRTRPCLQYQIKRCTAPCVNFITAESYQADVKRVRLFLEGKDLQIIEDLTSQMDLASQTLDYETAVRLRDQITYLRQIKQSQSIITPTKHEADIIALIESNGLSCIYVLTVREGQVRGGQAYFPQVPPFSEKKEILSGFIAQSYLQSAQQLPKQIFVDTPIDEQKWLSNTLSTLHQSTIRICHRPNKNQMHWLHMAQQNANHALSHEMQTQRSYQYQREALQNALHLPCLPKRLECFDISHTQGESPIASCVVFDTEGPCKKAYRRFNLTDITPGDDYGAIRQALIRHYKNHLKRQSFLPDLLIIDGGKGQLTQAVNSLQALKLIDKITVMAIAKGPLRKAGEETLFFPNQKNSIKLLPNDPALHLLQKIRDEAHRFAITSHRKKRAYRHQHSLLEKIPGIGMARRRQLLVQFGGIQSLKQASIDEICQLPGISHELAKRIYLALRN